MGPTILEHPAVGAERRVMATRSALARSTDQASGRARGLVAGEVVGAVEIAGPTARGSMSPWPTSTLPSPSPNVVSSVPFVEIAGGITPPMPAANP